MLPDEPAPPAPAMTGLSDCLADLLRSPLDERIRQPLAAAATMPLPAAAPACAQILLEAGLLDRAERLFEQIGLDLPAQPAGPVGLARLATRRRAWAAAAARWEALTRRFAHQVSPFWLAARAIALIELGGAEAAHAERARLEQEFPGSPAAAVLRAQIAMRDRAWRVALETWDELLVQFAEDGGRPGWEAARAAALVAAGRGKAAEAGLRAIVEARPHLLDPFCTLLRLCMAAGRPGEALALLDASPWQDLSVAALVGMRWTLLVRLHRIGDARAVIARTTEAARDWPTIEELAKAVPTVLEGPARVDAWRALIDRLDAMPLPSDPLERPPIDALRAQLQLAVADLPAFLGTTSRLTADHLGRSDRLVLRAAARVRDPASAAGIVPKVFGIGLPKTGTTTLAAALSILGFDVLDWQNPLTGALMTDDDLVLFDAFTDAAACVGFERFHERFSNAKFIYTTRPVEAWASSLLRHWHDRQGIASFAAMQQAIMLPDYFHHGALFREQNRALFLDHDDPAAAYRAHDRRVRRFFADKPGDGFLELDLFGGQGWSELCAFLGRPIPAQPFPWENRGAPPPADGAGRTS
jgi:tetratricopeptide (TPR) repeat protein